MLQLTNSVDYGGNVKFSSFKFSNQKKASVISHRKPRGLGVQPPHGLFFIYVSPQQMYYNLYLYTYISLILTLNVKEI